MESYSIGKERRISRIFNQDSQKTIVAALDHGVTLGPVQGIENVGDFLSKVNLNKLNAILAHRGILLRNSKSLENVPYILHLSAGTTLNPSQGHKILACSLEQAVFLGCEAVSFHLNLGYSNESQTLKDLAKTSQRCESYGLPLLVMTYTSAKPDENSKFHAEIKHAARVAYELGADIIKVPFTGSSEKFREIVEGVQVPVIVAGGSKISEKESLRHISEAINAGARGVCIGRNFFQSERPIGYLESLYEIVHRSKK